MNFPSRSFAGGATVASKDRNTKREATPMGNPKRLDDLIEELVTANRILARENILDSFGHISARHPDDPGKYLLSRARAPDCIEPEDIMTFTLDGSYEDDGRKPYVERFIHGAIYEARPDVHSVLHSHTSSVIPYGITGWKLRPVAHVGACIGRDIPVWDAQDAFGDTDLLVVNMAMGRDLIKTLGQNKTALMRGHGCVVVGDNIREVVFRAIQLDNNAKLQKEALAMSEITGKMIYMTDGEITAWERILTPYSWERAWENWCKRAGREYRGQELTGW
jgi:ribulose-5-phosphate 4-epimerase/fuculose-1-phosphate aldolase